MTRGVILAWCGGGVAVLAIVAALFWPMTASVAPLPAAGSMTLPTGATPGPVVPPAVVAPAAEVATTDARGRVVRTARPPATRAPGAAPVPARIPAQAAAGGGGAAVGPAARADPETTDPPTTTTADGGGGDGGNPFGDFFPGG